MLSFKMALRSISSNKMRAALTMLGIIIVLWHWLFWSLF